MAIPSVSTTAVYGSFQNDDATQIADLVDYEYGGVSLYDGSQGLLVKLWKIEVVGSDVIISENGANSQTLFSQSGITEISFTFDQNMNPFVAYVVDGVSKYYWYDSSLPGYTTTELPSGSTNPRVTFDDKRNSQILLDKSDIILAYLRTGNLYVRVQRERYLTEHLFKSGVTGKLLKVGMNNKNRLQFMIRK